MVITLTKTETETLKPFLDWAKQSFKVLTDPYGYAIISVPCRSAKRMVQRILNDPTLSITVSKRLLTDLITTCSPAEYAKRQTWAKISLADITQPKRKCPNAK